MRRPNGYGTVTKMPGNRRKPYAVRVPTRDHLGRVKQKYLSYHATNEEAWHALEAYRRKRESGEAPAPEDLGVTLQQVYALWSARKYEKAGRSSIASYKASWNHLSVLWSMPIRNIGIDHWQAIIDTHEHQNASKSKINNMIILMRALSLYAMERDWIHKDYTQFVIMPAVGPKITKGALSEDQLNKLKQLAASGFAGADAALVLCYTGFRINEFLSLLPESYDPIEDTLTGGSKSEAGKNRIIPVHPVIHPYIKHWLSVPAARLYAENSKRLSADAFRTRFFAPLAAAIGQENATPHWCRHTFSSRLKIAGADPLAIKRLMGHANKDITDHYTHTTTDYLRQNILKLT